MKRVPKSLILTFLVTFSLILTLPSCTFQIFDTETSLASPSSDISFSPDFLVEYNENGLTVLTKYYGPGGDIVIPDGIIIIGKHVFDLLTYTDERVITSVYIPDTVTIIEDYAFLCCYYMNEGLQQIRMSSNIEYIGVSAFDNCIYLETIEFDSVPQTTVSINDKAFAYCNSLKEVQLPASVLFGNDVFVGTELDKDYSAQYNSLPSTIASPETLETDSGEMEIVPEITHTKNDEENNLG